MYIVGRGREARQSKATSDNPRQGRTGIERASVTEKEKAKCHAGFMVGWTLRWVGRRPRRHTAGAQQIGMPIESNAGFSSNVDRALLQLENSIEVREKDSYTERVRRMQWKAPPCLPSRRPSSVLRLCQLSHLLLAGE